MNPLVSVIIPVYNGEKYIADAIRSALSQTYSPVELIVVDDGSTDASAAVARAFDSVLVVQQENLGIGGARNTGISASSGEYLAFLDADDLWDERKLEIQLAEFRDRPELDMVASLVQQFISPDLGEAERSRLVCPDEPVAGILPSAVVVRTSAFERVGPYNTSLRLGEFIEWHIRARERGLQSAMVEAALVRRRIHTSNQGIRMVDHRADYLRILKASLDRRRRSAADVSGSAGSGAEGTSPRIES